MSETHKETLRSAAVGYGTISPPSPEPTGLSTIIEPIIFLYSIAQGLSETVMTNLLEYRTCKMQLSLPDDNCTDPIAKAVEELIQPTTSNIIMSRSLMEALVPACMALFIGPWSDENGRKPFLIIVLAGSALTYLCCAILTLTPNLSGYMFAVASIPLAVTGGPCTIYLLSTCYITDVSDDSRRPFRLSLIILAQIVGVLFGVVSTKIVSFHLPINAFFIVFSLSSILLAMMIIYTLLFTRESVEIHESRNRQLFRLSQISSSLGSCFRILNGKARIMTSMIIIAIMLNVMLAKGEVTVSYLATREMFSWDLSDFTTYSLFSSLIYGLGVSSGTWLCSEVMGLPNIPLAAFLLSSRSVRCILMAFSTTGQHFYIAALVAMFYACYTPLCYSELCSIVDKHNLGKVLALSTFVDNFSPIISSPAYTYVYQITYLHFPGSVFVLGAAISAISAILLLIVYTLQMLTKSSDCTESL